MPEEPLTEGQLIDAYRGVRRRDMVPEEHMMPGHMHVQRRPNDDRVLVWHTHPGYTIRHPLDVEQAHAKPDPRRDTLKTADNKKLEDV